MLLVGTIEMMTKLLESYPKRLGKVDQIRISPKEVKIAKVQRGLWATFEGIGDLGFPQKGLSPKKNLGGAFEKPRESRRDKKEARTHQETPSEKTLGKSSGGGKIKPHPPGKISQKPPPRETPIGPPP